MAITKEELDKYIKAYSEGKPLITDEEYDDLLEEYLKENGEDKRPFLRNKQSDNINNAVGTLTKLYGVTKAMRPDKKIFTDWSKNRDPKRKIIVQPKFDGCSVAYDRFTEQLFTRGNVDDGESIDVTTLFSSRVRYEMDPKNSDCDPDTIKFEAEISNEVFDKYLRGKYERPLNAASAGISSRNSELVNYITLIPLRMYRERHAYIPEALKELSLITTMDDVESIEQFIADKLSDGATVVFDNMTYRIDGVVVSELVPCDRVPGGYEIGDEAAIKILNNTRNTKIITIDYQYGKTGKITPVGILEPVNFGNLTVDHVSIANLDRVVKLGLKYNDTVRIVHNIVPYLIDTAGDGSVPIPVPQNCPICGAPLNYKTLKTVRCTNPKCSGLRIGMIHRYCEKMKMFGIAKGTLTKLFDSQVLESISDLYTLSVEKMLSVPGIKEKSANNIAKSISEASHNVPLSRWMGALPIKDVSAKTWDTIIKAKFGNDMMTAANIYQAEIMNGNPDSFMMNCIPDYVYGVSVNTYKLIREGLVTYWKDIQETIPYITFNVLSKLESFKGRVTLTGTRDEQLTNTLVERGYEVDSFSSKTIALVIPDRSFVSSKVTKANQNQIPVYTIEEAYEALK